MLILSFEQNLFGKKVDPIDLEHRFKSELLAPEPIETSTLLTRGNEVYLSNTDASDVNNFDPRMN